MVMELNDVIMKFTGVVMKCAMMVMMSFIQARVLNSWSWD